MAEKAKPAATRTTLTMMGSQALRILNDFDQVKWNDNQTLVARRSRIINTRGITSV
jgi:hypothetical protein